MVVRCGNSIMMPCTIFSYKEYWQAYVMLIKVYKLTVTEVELNTAELIRHTRGRLVFFSQGQL